MGKDRKVRVETPRDINQAKDKQASLEKEQIRSKYPLTEWEQVQLFEVLKKGPEVNPETWDATLEDLVRLIDHHQPRLWSLVSDPFAISDEWDETQHKQFLELVKKTYNCGDAYEKSRSPEDLRAFGDALHKTLAAQALPNRSEDEVLTDYLNAGRVVRSEENCSWVLDAHGREFVLPNAFLPPSLALPPEIVDKEEGRPFEAGHCVRLETDDYSGKGVPKWAIGYVQNLVSNNSFGHDPNYCRVIFVTDYDAEEQSWTGEYLEVRDGDLKLCDEDHRLRAWFPFEVEPNGFLKKGEDGRFEPSSRARSYTYEELCDKLMVEDQQVRELSEVTSSVQGSSEARRPSWAKRFITKLRGKG